MSENKPRYEATPNYSPRGGWMNRTAAAVYASVSTRQIDRWRAEGLPSSKFGKVVRIQKADLDRFLKRMAAEAVG